MTKFYRSFVRLIVIATLLFSTMAPIVASAQADPLTDAESKFLSDMSKQNDQFQTALGGLGEEFGDMADDPTLIVDQDWIIGVATNLASLQIVHQNALDLIPSQRQQHLFVYWVEITGLMDSATDDYADFVDNLDTDASERGSAKVTQAGVFLDEFNTALGDFNDDPDSVLNQANLINSPVSNCDPFDTYALGQVYYAIHPEEQGTIDPNLDGRACEVYFEHDVVEVDIYDSLASMATTNQDTPTQSATGDSACSIDDMDRDPTITSDEGNPLAGRLGTTRDEWESVYGVSTEEFVLGFAYDVDGCGKVIASFDPDGYVYQIDLYAPRDSEDSDPYAGDPNDWNGAQAALVAASFAPGDTIMMEQYEVPAPMGYLRVDNLSPAMVDDVPYTVFEYVDNDIDLGQFSVIFHLTDTDSVGWITLKLSLEEPPVQD